jgi:hypothetical protein
LPAPQPASLAHGAQAALLPLQPNGAHAAAPGAEPPTSEHSPSRAAPAATEQASHAPLQAVLQQRPSLQKPLVHSEFCVQTCPVAPLN